MEMLKSTCSLILAVVFGFTLGAGTSSPVSCDTWVALPDATADGSVILAKNSDRPSMEAQVLVHMPRASHPTGEKVKCTYIEIPQVTVTYEHIGSKIWWAFGYEHGMNEHGVAIGNEAAWSREPYQWGDGLLGMDLLRLGLERGRTAYDSMRIIIDLLQQYGQSGDCEYPGEWGKANYHNSFIIADPKEAWVLETAGKYWVAKKVSHGVYSISNIYSIEADWTEAHPKLVSHAVEKGWARSAEDFNFARDYGDYWRKDSPNPGDMQVRRNASLALCQKMQGKIDPAAMMRFLRNHHEGTLVESRWGAAETFWPSLCMHDNPQRGYHTAASEVCHLRGSMPPLLRQVYWASFSNPCSNVFKPFYMNGPQASAGYAVGTSAYSSDSPWWQAHRIKLLCDLNYRGLNPEVRRMWDETEKWILERQPAQEKRALDLLGKNQTDAAVAVLQRFVDENCARIEKEYAMLNKDLPVRLEKLGVEYLFLDFLRDWSVRKGVPLPLDAGKVRQGRGGRDPKRTEAGTGPRRK
jgi:secernin